MIEELFSIGMKRKVNIAAIGNELPTISICENIDREIHQQMFRCKQDNIFQPFRPFSNPYMQMEYM